MGCPLPHTTFQPPFSNGGRFCRSGKSALLVGATPALGRFLASGNFAHAASATALAGFPRLGGLGDF